MLLISLLSASSAEAAVGRRLGCQLDRLDRASSIFSDVMSVTAVRGFFIVSLVCRSKVLRNKNPPTSTQTAKKHGAVFAVGTIFGHLDAKRER